MDQDKLNELIENIHIPKVLARITVCGSIVIDINDRNCNGWKRPTPEQIKNLHDMLCIDVKLFDEGEDG